MANCVYSPRLGRTLHCSVPLGSGSLNVRSTSGNFKNEVLSLEDATQPVGQDGCDDDGDKNG